MTDIIIQGIGGRMGHVLCEMIAQREDCRVVAGIDMKDGEMNGIPVYDSLDKLDGFGKGLSVKLHDKINGIAALALAVSKPLVSTDGQAVMFFPAVFSSAFD